MTQPIPAKVQLRTPLHPAPEEVVSVCVVSVTTVPAAGVPAAGAAETGTSSRVVVVVLVRELQPLSGAETSESERAAAARRATGFLISGD